MRIRKITVEGFGPFRERQVVDFAAFDAAGIFLICGETGAGKSTILDGIAYALYGRTPRWEDTAATGVSNRVRSDFCAPDDPTEVVLEFEANGADYRITRSPEYERAKDRGAGTTKHPAKVLVERDDGDGWQALATKERGARELIERLIKLTSDEFLQVVLLAQGRFQAFLLANSGERVDLLSKLFGARRFRDYQDGLAARRTELGRQVQISRTELDTTLAAVKTASDLGEVQPDHELDWVDAVIARARRALDEAAAQLAEAEAAETQADERFTLATRQQTFARAMAQSAKFHAQEPQIAEAREALERANRAERVRPLIDAAKRASELSSQKARAVDAARGLYRGGVDDEALPGEVSRLDGEIGQLVAALPDEARAEELGQARAQADSDVARLTGALGSLVQRIEQLQDERDTFATAAAQVTSRQETADRIEEQLQKATAAEDARSRLATAQEAQLTAEQAHNKAQVAATDLLSRFLHGQAASLASGLEDGRPCPVCGSLDHPAPAASSAEPVTEDEWTAARDEAEKLEPQVAAARHEADTVRQEVAALAGAVGDNDVASLTAAWTTAGTELREATSARERIADIDAVLQGDVGLLAGRVEAAEVLAQAQTQVATLGAQRDDLLGRLAQLRGDFETVQERHDALSAERKTAKQLVAAIDAERTAVEQSDDADELLAANARQQGFESVQDVVQALLAQAETDGLKRQVEAYDRAVNETQGVLRQPELQNLPLEAIEPIAAEQACQSAKDATKSAVAAQAAARAALDTLDQQRRSLTTTLEQLTKLRAEYETLNRLVETVNGRPPNTKGMSLESYYVAAEFEDVLAAANGRLGAMSGGRFTLQHTERGVRKANAVAGLEVEIMDEYTGKARDPHTLSGGEQFLTSLALALGLAEVVTSRAGGVQLETLFVDEGFGGLSPAYLDVAMSTLETLREDGRTVGVISHVESMKESIAAQLRVTRSPGGASHVEQVAPC